ncbi:S-adenosylmethionine:tRNA ribosyltransferase-isomerase [Actinophytocola sp.]|uniref:S-adenosylmethionine:tRNA ribosyltransferase-isomerase n=1 Tax=Actinophytocola sp. TaxID=1872138 RepID=UPI003D6AC642
MTVVMDFVLPADFEAHEPPEARGLTRDGVRLLVSEGATGRVSHHRFADLPVLLRAGDLLVVNTSATMPAAVSVVDSGLAVHICTELPSGRWLVELRRVSGKATEPFGGGAPGQRFELLGGGSVTLREPFSGLRGQVKTGRPRAKGPAIRSVLNRPHRLWESDVDTLGRGVPAYLSAFGAPIRYSYVAARWPLSYYQTVFGTTPGSAEMPSASRPFTDRLVTSLVSAGVQFAPILLHTGVASPEAHERPYPERYAVSETSARLVNAARAEGRRVLAIGTTAVRAIESAASPAGVVSAASGWTDLVVTPERGVRVVSGLLTGFHEPRASHLDMLAAIAGPDLLNRTYAEAVNADYLWHEFGDVNLLLP